MAEFRDLAEFQIVKPVRLPINGNVYEFPGDISARGLVRLQQLNYQIEQLHEGTPVPEDERIGNDEMAAIEDELFGGLKQKMIDNDVLSSQLKAVFWTLMNYHLAGEDEALNFWNSQGEADAPNRAARRHPAKKAARSRGSRGSSPSQKPSQPAGRPGTKSSDTES